MVSDIAEAEIGKQRGTQGIVKPAGDALVAAFGYSCQAKLAETDSTQGTENCICTLAVVRETVAAKRMHLRRGLIVYADIELVAVEDTVPALREIVS